MHKVAYAYCLYIESFNFRAQVGIVSVRRAFRIYLDYYSLYFDATKYADMLATYWFLYLFICLLAFVK